MFGEQRKWISEYETQGSMNKVHEAKYENNYKWSTFFLSSSFRKYSFMLNENMMLTHSVQIWNIKGCYYLGSDLKAWLNWGSDSKMVYSKAGKRVLSLLRRFQFHSLQISLYSCSSVPRIIASPGVSNSTEEDRCLSVFYKLTSEVTCCHSPDIPLGNGVQ